MVGKASYSPLRRTRPFTRIVTVLNHLLKLIKSDQIKAQKKKKKKKKKPRKNQDQTFQLRKQTKWRALWERNINEERKFSKKFLERLLFLNRDRSIKRVINPSSPIVTWGGDARTDWLVFIEMRVRARVSEHNRVLGRKALTKMRRGRIADMGWPTLHFSKGLFNYQCALRVLDFTLPLPLYFIY